MISGIVLAAGSAQRMGQQKLLLDFKGKPVLQWVLETALVSDLSEVICVVQQSKDLRQKIPLEHDKLRWVSNKNASQGQSTSVIAGLKAVSPMSEAALFIVGDQPLIQPELINNLIDLFRKSGARIGAPVFAGEARNPVLFHRTLFPELLQLTGDRGGRGLIETHKDEAAFLEWREESPFLDLDVWEDYERLKR